MTGSAVRQMLLAVMVACAATSAMAAPPLDASDGSNIDKAIAERSLVPRVTELRDAVTSTTSDLVLNAMNFLGVPYRRGGTSSETGFDCSGFVRAVYDKTFGLVLPHRAAEQASSTQVINKDDLRPGDLVFFNTMRRAFSHVGIYVGDGKFIHSPRAGGRVRVEDMRESYWSTRFNGARRVEGANPSALQLLQRPGSAPQPE